MMAMIHWIHQLWLLANVFGGKKMATEKSIEWSRFEKSSQRKAGKTITAPWICGRRSVIIVTIILMVFVMAIVVI